MGILSQERIIKNFLADAPQEEKNMRPLALACALAAFTALLPVCVPVYAQSIPLQRESVAKTLSTPDIVVTKDTVDVRTINLFQALPVNQRNVQYGNGYDVNGATYDQAWILPGRKNSTLAMDLGASSPWKNFRFNLGALMPYKGYEKPVQIEIVGDGKRLFASTYSSVEPLSPVDVDIEGVRALQIRVNSACPQAEPDFAVSRALSLYMVEPKLSKDASAQSTPSRVRSVQCAPAIFTEAAPPIQPSAPVKPVKALW
ncbi:MAG: NPCBM/NEW2 domain-containing protein [Gloeobacterales cyanobacterium]